MTRTTLFRCWDVMLGRGVDRLLSRSVDPRLHEPYVDDAPPHRLEMTPMRIRGFRLQRATDEESRWLAEALDRTSLGAGGTRVARTRDGRLVARPDG